MPDYSFYINLVKEFLYKNYKFTYKIDTKLPVAGRVSYKKKLVRINSYSAKEALLISLHESGHVIGWNRTKKKKLTIYQEEIQAYLYGWYLLKKIKADKVLIKLDWVRHNLESGFGYIEDLENKNKKLKKNLKNL